MKTKSISLFIIFLLILSYVKISAQTTATLTPTADAYTSCTSTDVTNYGSDPYVKIAYNTNSTLKYNGFLRFRMSDELFANLANVTSIEFGIYSDGTGLSTARQVKVSYIPISAASPNTIWVESEINGVFRSGMGLGSGTANTSLFYFTKADSDPAKYYITTSTPTTNAALYNAIVTTYKTQQEINLRLYPNETFTVDGKNPNQVDATGINFVSKDNPNFDASYFPYLKFTYTITVTDVKNENLNAPKVIATSNLVKILNEGNSYNLSVFNLAGAKIYGVEKLKGNSEQHVILPLGVYIFKIVTGTNVFTQKIQITD